MVQNGQRLPEGVHERNGEEKNLEVDQVMAEAPVEQQVAFADSQVEDQRVAGFDLRESVFEIR